jgi:hypothetical protein
MSLETVSETVPILNSIPVPNSASNVPLEAIPETIPVSKTIHIKNKTRSEFDTYYDNYCIKALRALKTQNKSLAALGMLFLVRSLLPSSGGRLKIDRIVSATGMSKSNILAQLEALENVGLMTTITRDISGRLISFPQGTENNTGAELDTHMSSSSFYNKTTSTTIGEMSTEEMDIRNDAHIESNTGNEFDTYTESNTGNKSIDSVFKKRLHNNAISIEFSAQELFFIAKASKVNIDKLTGQCFKYYHDVKGDIGGKYTNGLFLNLLSKAKDNPTAYIIKAIQQGATASLDDETRAEKILKAGEDIFKKIGVDILQKELEVALLLLSSSGKSQEIIQQECKAFIKRMISKA